MNKNYIILNGKRYNAITGELIASETPKKSIDMTASVAQPKATLQSTVSTPPKPVKRDRTHHNTAAAKLAPRKPKKATTLMRHAVKKPTNNQHKSIKQAYPVTHSASHSITPKKSAHAVDASKVHRAAQVEKSSKVNRFGTSVKPSMKAQVKPVALRPVPANAHHTATAQKSQTVKQPALHKVAAASAKPVDTKKKHISAQIKKQHLLEQALKNAVSHEQPEHTLEKLSAPKRRLLSSFAVLGAVLVIGSFVMYLNRSSVELQVASVRAGFQASAPAAPAGYERQTASANNGTVAIGFVSPKNNDSFTLTQESSGWDSQTLFDSIVAVDNNNYQAIQSHGRTIYVYGGDKAAWVDGGILYKVSGSKQLDSDQIVSLATSM